MWFDLADYYRRTPTKKYPERIVQGEDYRKLSSKERKNRKGHKYEVLRVGACETAIVGVSLYHAFFSISPEGRVYTRLGYRWDGPSGPTVDTASFMRGSKNHDVWFQVLRELDALIDKGKITFSREWPTDRALIWQRIFDAANRDLRKHCREDGMMWPRYHWVHRSVQRFGASHAGKK